MTCATCGFPCAPTFCGQCFTQRAREQANAAGLVRHLDAGLKPRPTWAPYAVDDWTYEWWTPSAAPSWLAWFEWHGFMSEATYLGVLSGRTGPDPVDAKQHCGCFQCTGEDS